MALDAENHDTGSRFDIRALTEFGDFGFAVGGADDGSGELDGLSVGAGFTFGDITIGVSYDEEDTAIAASDFDTPEAVTGVSIDTTFGGASIGLSYITSDAESSTGIEVGFDVSADLSVGVYYASNDVADDKYGVSAAYTKGVDF